MSQNDLVQNEMSLFNIKKVIYQTVTSYVRLICFTYFLCPRSVINPAWLSILQLFPMVEVVISHDHPQRSRF